MSLNQPSGIRNFGFNIEIEIFKYCFHLFSFLVNKIFLDGVKICVDELRTLQEGLREDAFH